MGNYIDGNALRDNSLGRYVQGQSCTITAGGGTKQLFTVAGGEVLITALWGKATTAITLDTETLAVQIDPTAGTTVTWVTATDVGTTDTAVGDILGFMEQGDGTTDFKVNGQPLMNYIATTGEIELVAANVTGTEDGAMDWFCTYVPLTPGATVVAATT